MHAFVLHFEPRRLGPFTVDLHVAKLHRAHHADPWNGPLTFIPKRTFLHVAVALAFMRLLFGSVAPWVATTLAAYAVLALRYEWSHYLAHIRYTPRWAVSLAKSCRHRRISSRRPAMQPRSRLLKKLSAALTHSATSI